MHHSLLSLLAVGLVSVTPANAQTRLPIVVDTPPNFVRPYVIPHLRGPILNLGDTAFRFPVTGPSSGGALTLLTTNGGISADLNVFPHRHIARYENFFCSRGGVQLWTHRHNGTQHVRKLTAGDYGASPSNATHTFQIVEPNTEMYGVVFAGGLEDMFFAFSQNVSYPSFGPYDPSTQASAGFGSSGGAPGGAPGGGAGGGFLDQFDIYPNPTFVPRRDIVNGSGPASTGWHTAKNELPTDPNDPYYVARDMGPKYLNKDFGFYQVIQPLNTPKQSDYHNFTLSFLSIALRPQNVTVPAQKYAGHSGFRVEEGALTLEVEGYREVQLLHGDVAFIPGNTTYKYHSSVTYTKVLYFSAETKGLDSTLIAKSKPWDSAVWPAA